MAGAGRKSGYRKHLTDQVLNDFPVPGKDERIAQVVATRGGNQFEVRLPNRQAQLALLPTKFHKLVWVKRNDYVIVQTSGDDGDDHDGDKTAKGVRYMINHILYKDQIKHLKSEKLWPEEFDNDEEVEAPLDSQAADDGIVYDDGIDDDDLFVNTNRLAQVKLDDSSSSDEDS